MNEWMNEWMNEFRLCMAAWTTLCTFQMIRSNLFNISLIPFMDGGWACGCTIIIIWNETKLGEVQNTPTRFPARRRVGFSNTLFSSLAQHTCTNATTCAIGNAIFLKTVFFRRAGRRSSHGGSHNISYNNKIYSLYIYIYRPTWRQDS